MNEDEASGRLEGAHPFDDGNGRIACAIPDLALRDIMVLIERGVLVQNPASGRSTSYEPATLAEEPGS